MAADNFLDFDPIKPRLIPFNLVPTPSVSHFEKDRRLHFSDLVSIFNPTKTFLLDFRPRIARVSVPSG